MTTPPSKPLEEMTEAEVCAWQHWLLEQGKRPRPFAWGRLIQAPADPESLTALDLTKAYRWAFEEFSLRVQFVQHLAAEENLDITALDAALLEVEKARPAYNACRDALARHLLASSHVDRVKRMAELLWEVEGRPDGTLVSESKYDYESSLNRVIERSPDGNRYIVGVRNAELQRLQELSDEGTPGFFPRLRRLRSG